MSGSVGKSPSLELDGDGDVAASPMQAVILAMGACTLIDVIAGIERHNLASASIGLDYERADSPPRVYTSIFLHYNLSTDAPEMKIRRLIEASQEKYCSVGSMIQDSGADVSWTLNLEPI